MTLSIIMIVFGAGFLVKGADWLVDGGSGIALKSGVSHLVVGLTVIAFGTSAPELASSVVAVLKGSGDICFGNVVGSNVANIALILGVTAMIQPVAVNLRLTKFDMPFMVIISVLTCIVGYMHQTYRLFGILLLILFGYFMFRCFRGAVSDADVHDEAAHKSYAMLGFLVAVGMAGLVFGAKLFVSGAQDIARTLGVTESVIGLTVVALGTSLPELVTSAIAARKGHADISLGNIVGSNIFNILLVLGVSVTMIPFPVSPDRFLLLIGMPSMLLLAVLLLQFSIIGNVISRKEGGFFFLIYCLYTLAAVFLS